MSFCGFRCFSVFPVVFGFVSYAPRPYFRVCVSVACFCRQKGPVFIYIYIGSSPRTLAGCGTTRYGLPGAPDKRSASCMHRRILGRVCGGRGCTSERIRRRRTSWVKSTAAVRGLSSARLRLANLGAQCLQVGQGCSHPSRQVGPHCAGLASRLRRQLHKVRRGLT
jgi:hypothetical protein